MHSIGIVIACLIATAMSVSGIAVAPAVMIAALVVSVVVVGVPHGGLDHWTGRRLLRERFPSTWAMIFFPAYLIVALIVVGGWFLLPIVTAVSFIVISAWHFGMEDEPHEFKSAVVRHLVAAAIGGLVIWVPVCLQAERFEYLLTSVLHGDLAATAGTIVSSTRLIALLMIPVAGIVIVRDLSNSKTRVRAIRNIGFVMLFATTDVLLSFGIYFCGWHSVRGLKRLALENRTTLRSAYWSAMPLSIGAVAMGGLGMWFWSSGQTISDAMTRTLFVTLSAIAVPHLLLHWPLADATAEVAP